MESYPDLKNTFDYVNQLVKMVRDLPTESIQDIKFKQLLLVEISAMGSCNTPHFVADEIRKFVIFHGDMMDRWEKKWQQEHPFPPSL